MGSNPIWQGFRQVCKVADMFVKAPDLTNFGTARRGLGACSPRKFFKKEHLVLVSQEFSLKSKILNENGKMVGDGGREDGNSRIVSC